MEIWLERNPFGFVPFPERVPRRKLVRGKDGHDRRERDQFSGTFECKLRTRTPLCVNVLFKRLHGKKAYLPGSTLRGAVRNMAQALGAGCAALYEEKVPKELMPCTADTACLVCRVFGYAAKKESQSWAGKVRFHDTEEIAAEWRKLPSSPMKKPWDQPEFWEEDAVNGAGWRVFRHAREVGPVGGEVWSVAAEQVFGFEVDFENLDAEELAVLRFALSLRHDCAAHDRHVQLCHKIGYAKASGLGSCEISITAQRAAASFGRAAKAVPAGGCEIEEYFKLPGWNKLCELLDFEAAPERLVRAGAWLESHPGARIAEFEAGLKKVIR